MAHLWRRSRRGRKAVLAILVIVLVSGCGKSATEVFRTERLAPLQQRAEQQTQRLEATLVQIPRKHRSAVARLVRQEVGALATTAIAIERLRPPSEVKGLFARYTAAYATLIRALEGFTSALEDASMQEFLRASDQAQAATSAVHTAEEDLARALRS